VYLQEELLLEKRHGGFLCGVTGF